MKKELHLGIAYNVYLPELDLEFHPCDELVEAMAQEVYAALSSAGYAVTMIPLEKNLFDFCLRLKEEKIDVLINLCEGYLNQSKFEANLAALFELMGLAFTGNDSRALAICQDKFRTKAILKASGLPTPKGELIFSSFQEVSLSYPLIVKPTCEDASIGISIDSVVYDKESLQIKINQILKKYRQPALVEEYIDGREFNVALLAKEGQGVKALPISEIDFSSVPENMPRICSYEAKWDENHELYRATPPICPARLSWRWQRQIQALAIAAFRAVGCRDYARVDMRLSSSGKLYILEVNPNPDISLNAGYARALKAAGLPYSEFWEIMITNALERKRKLERKREIHWPQIPFDSSSEQFLFSLVERAARSRRKGGRW
ncbi:MAG: ATP-grasp domain-containing protein [Candidatus Aminicenantes bacterium]|nr:ATP-grasp domain-containing protein [Candidatus Aminicenantes bacterium]